MADDLTLPAAGARVATDEVDARHYQLVKLSFGADGSATLVSGSAGLPVSVVGSVATAGLTNAELRASAVPVTVSDGSGPLTVDGTVAISGAVAVTGTFWQATQPVSGPLTDAQLRASAVPVTVSDGSGPITVDGTVAVTGTFWQATQPVSGPLTDAELRAAAVPVVGPLTDAQLRAAALAVNQAGVSATGSLAALNATVALSLAGATGFAVDLRGTFVATVTFQGTIDGTNWFNLPVLPAGAAASVATVTTSTAAGAWTGNANGMQQVRAIATAFTSGSVTVTLRAMQATGVVYAVAGGQTTQPVSGTVTANIGTGSLAAGTNAIGDVGLQIRANATGAASVHHIVAAASTNAGVIKAGAGRVVGWCLSNPSAAWRYVKLHNTTTAPTVGTTPVVLTIGIPPGNKAECNHAVGLGFATGISRSIVAGAADNDATAVALNDVVGDIFFA